jgi:hypothetical protein
MIRKFSFGLLVVCSFGLLLLGADDPFVGTWKLNVAKSHFAKGHETADLTIIVARQGDIATTMVNGTDGAGKVISVKYTVPVTGGTLNFTEGGPPAGMTEVMKRVDDHTVDITSTMNEKQVLVQHVVVSTNGKTLTSKETGVDENGKDFKNVNVYGRQ